MKIYLRMVSESDKDDLLDWRNDPLTREMSFHSELITPQQHEKWFHSILDSNEHVIYIVEDGNRKKMGVVRFHRLNDGRFEINITLAPSQRGKGWAALMIEQGCAKIFAEHKAREIVARIKPQNQASLKSFMRAGFVRFKEDRDTVELGLRK